MRTIKFRGKLTCETSPLFNPKGDWCTGFYHEDLHYGEWKSFIKCGELNLEVDKDTVGQFTGLLDKNGTEIYEGDIVTFDNHLQGISQIIYDYAGFEVISKNYRTALRPMMNNHIMVIGNIHDNQRMRNELSTCTTSRHLPIEMHTLPRIPGPFRQKSKSAAR